MILQKGYIYYLSGFTGPKVFNGLNFICLFTLQVISRDWDITSATGIHITAWPYTIYSPERFDDMMSDPPGRKRIRAAVDHAINELNPLLLDQYKRHTR